MRDRIELGTLLKNVSGTDNVYFQPAANIHLVYPCIIYKRARRQINRANNMAYIHNVLYSITVIDKDPDSDIPRKIAELPNCASDRAFQTDGLYHDTFTITF